MYRKTSVWESLFDKVAGRHLLHRTPPEDCFLSVHRTNSYALLCSVLKLTLSGTAVSNNFQTFESFNLEFIFVRMKVYTSRKHIQIGRTFIWKFTFYGRTFSTKNLIKAMPKVLNEACALKLCTYQLQLFPKLSEILS